MSNDKVAFVVLQFGCSKCKMTSWIQFCVSETMFSHYTNQRE